MGKIALLLKYLPMVLAVLDAAGKLFDAVKSKSRALAADQNTRAEDQILDKQVERLIEIGYQFLPPYITTKVTKAEVKAFTDKVEAVCFAVHEAMVAFVPLTK